MEKFANINEDNVVSALDGFVDKENEDWELYFWSKSSLCVLFLKRFVWNIDEEIMNVLPLGVAALYPACFKLILWSINTHVMWVKG